MGKSRSASPRAANMKIVVRVDCYGVPREPMDEFMQRFSKGVLEMPDFSPSSSQRVRSFEFEVNHDSIH